MKLIDADALIAQMEADAEHIEEPIAKMFAYAAINDVKHAPTIEERKQGDIISRQAAIDALHMHLMYRMGTDSNKKRLDDWINGLSSAQPEIIRCKDCEHYDDGLCRRWKYSHVTSEDSFCSGAERREE